MVGALIILVALAADPFTQQVIQYETCYRVDSSTAARVPRTNFFSRGGMLSGSDSQAELEVGLTAAVNMAIIQGPTNQKPVIPFNCISSNCTFPHTDGAAFQTLGVCSMCKDITPWIVVNTTAPNTGYILYSRGFKDDKSPKASVGPVNAANPNEGQTLMWGVKDLAHDETFDDLLTFNTIMLTVDRTCDLQRTSGCPKRPAAFQCSLYPCVKTYSTAVTKTKLEERVLDTQPLTKTCKAAEEVTTARNLTWSLATDRALRNGKWEECSTSSTWTESHSVPVAANKTIPIGDVDEDVVYHQPDCAWQYGYASALSLNQYLSWMFDQEGQWSPDGGTTVTKGSLKMLYRNGTATLNTTSAFMASLADAITARVRQSGDTPVSGQATGAVLTQQTCVGVAWEWLVLPAALVFLSAAFLAATAIACLDHGLVA